MRKTLLTRLRPEANEKLLSNRAKYTYAVDHVILKLESTESYSELTVQDLDIIITFTETDRHNRTYLNWIYGDDIFE
jgi:hypothetical protein